MKIKKLLIFFSKFKKMIFIKKPISIALLSCLIMFLCVFCYKINTHKRDGLIVEVPIEAFDKNGNLIDKNWKKYLHTSKPIGVIFFKNHFPNKEIGKKIVGEVKNAINDYVILSADE